MYISTKTYPSLGSTVFRQWRADSHCNQLHGYSFTFHFEFESMTLDDRNWVMDFGSLKPLEKQLNVWFDHTLVVARDDPKFSEICKLDDLGLAKVMIFEHVGCEFFAGILYNYVNNEFLQNKNIWCSKVEVREHDRNSAMKIGHRPEITWESSEKSIKEIKIINTGPFGKEYPVEVNYGNNQGAGG